MTIATKATNYSRNCFELLWKSDLNSSLESV
nr:MAG TPA: hypothetical protein [Caudoviricetes sp.]